MISPTHRGSLVDPRDEKLSKKNFNKGNSGNNKSMIYDDSERLNKNQVDSNSSKNHYKYKLQIMKKGGEKQSGQNLNNSLMKNKKLKDNGQCSIY